MEPVAPAAQFARRLRAAEQKEREERFLAAAEVPEDVDVVVVADRPPAHHPPDELLVLQPVECALHLDVAQLHHRIAVRLLIRRGDERIQRQRVVLRRGELLLHQRAEDADLDRVELAGKTGTLLRVVERRNVAHYARFYEIAKTGGRALRLRPK